MTGLPDLIHERDLAKRWGMKPNALHVHRHRGHLPPGVKIGRSTFYHPVVIDAYETARTLGHPYEASVQKAVDALKALEKRGAA